MTKQDPSIVRDQMNQYLQDAIQMGEARVSLPEMFLSPEDLPVPPVPGMPPRTGSTTEVLDPFATVLGQLREKLGAMGTEARSWLEDEILIPRSKERQAKEFNSATERLKKKIDAGQVPSDVLVRRVLKLQALLEDKAAPTQAQVDSAVARFKAIVGGE